MNYKLEICANSVASCLEAQKGGAYRVELCASIPEGGTTPSYATIALARELSNIKLHVIIRPRGGDFLYSPLEHKIMLNDIETAKKLHADGVVIGCLTPHGDVDMQRNRELIDAAEGMSVTFHRAFDMCRNPFESLENIISLGCDRILTSGRKPKAEQGAALIKQLIQQAGDRIVIMPGSGINEYNIAKIARETGAKEFHLSVRERVESNMIYRNPNLSMASTTITIDEYVQEITSALRVEKALKNLQQTD